VTAAVPTLVARTTSVGETQDLAAALAALAQPGDLIVLAGDLGAGKTAFVQGFGAGLGVTEPITSPTFTLAQQYEGRMLVHHLDVYRLDQLGEVAELGLAELLDDGGVVLIEWGDAILPVLPNDFLEVRLTFGDGPPGAHDVASEAGPDPGSDPVPDPPDDERLVVLRTVGPSWVHRQVSLLQAITPWAVAPTVPPADPAPGVGGPPPGGVAPC
jgi:tRNA threonylcarbamoyladenosine biosynthesis protein TsaE